MRIGLIMSRELSVRIPKNVLIVDSDLNQRLSLALILKRAGYLVTTVGQACEALDRLETGNYHLVILDIMSMDNKLTLLPTVLQRYPTTCVLVFTAQWSPETAAEIEQMGVSAHLEKPVTPGALLDCVETILKKGNPN
jgi:Response regulator containing CheY-like receiver, AAA-type ATPase, and DNA-binding domains